MQRFVAEKQIANSSLDAFVTKLDPTGSTLVYSTYLGGGGTDFGNGIAVDADGNTYVAGGAGSGGGSGFPTTGGAFQTNCFGDAFVAKLNATGTLIYSTCLGGSGAEGAKGATGIAVDADGNAYVTGETFSKDFPTTAGAFQAECRLFLPAPVFPKPCSGDVFVAKLNATGSALEYSTYLGGGGEDLGGAIALDASGSAYVTGYTKSSDFPGTAASPIQAALGGVRDAFVTKLNAGGSALEYSTYLRRQR